jgi:Leucine-rich repeat (LRR) protein
MKMPFLRLFAAFALMLVALTGCDSYRVTVNDLAVYEPSPLFSNFSIDDRALFACVQQTIEDKRITSLEQLTVLNCSHAGITSLKGLATFTYLEALNLASNKLSDIQLLQETARLRKLDLQDNQLVSAKALLVLPNLEQVDLHGNATLDCGDAQALAKLVSNTRLPAHCGG